jgi:peptide deformylase
MHVPAQYDLDKPDGKRLNPEIDTPLILINPVLDERRGAQSQQEGCLSFPGIYASVHRAYEVTVSFIDLKGNPRRFDARGLMARVIQHELDHLNGVLFVDRITAIKKIALSARLRKLKREA